MAGSRIAAKIKSPFASKINIAQVVGMLAMVLSVWGIDLPPDIQAIVVTAITSLMALVTWVLRTWFTTKITPQSAKRILR